ncbi:hypothetical protein RUM43_014989 [Polyplax serrata]|uniref:PH domain-containing protein n=1 Tax=Polyplax serrata TaxID=468196 RepID=A0AAN8P497_POLSC
MRREKLDTHFSNTEEAEQRNILEEVQEEKLNKFNCTGHIEDEGAASKHTSDRKIKLRRLALLYSGKDDILLSEDAEEPEPSSKVSHNTKQKCKLGRLAELATKINEWEDDVNHSKHVRPPRNNKFHEQVSQSRKENEKPKAWDQLAEQLGFSSRQSKLTYNFTKLKEDEEIRQQPTPKQDKKNCPTTMSPNGKLTRKQEDKNQVKSDNPVLQKVAFFETAKNDDCQNQIKDPTELSVAERKALFERNSDVSKKPNEKFSNHSFIKPPSNCDKIPVIEKSSCTREKEISSDKIIRQQNVKQKVKAQVNYLSDENIVSHGVTHSSDYQLKVVEQVKEENIPKPPPMPCASVEEKTLHKKENLVSPNSRLYPSLSELDVSEVSDLSVGLLETYETNDSCSSNVCLNMSLSELLEMNKNNPTTPPSDISFSKSKECQVLDKMDKLLESALNEVSSECYEDSGDDYASPPKIMKSSSFEFKRKESVGHSLLHTVSFYRKQQQNYTPSEEIATQPDIIEDQSVLVENKIQELSAEVNKQQTIISQASQALNLCLSTVEFSGSGEQVEGERLLLLASHKREACLNELQRLKIENSLQPQGQALMSEKGDVTLSNISIMLKRDALRAMTAAENLHYFVCLAKSDERVLATPVVPATRENLSDSNLKFPGTLKLEALLSNFRVTVEVYSLELSKELLPHDIKYHISTKKDKKLLTPIKSKKFESKLVKPHIQSPAGPHAVRTSNFRMCGFIVFSLREVGRKQWILNKVPYVSSLEGTLSMSINSQLKLDDEFRGFLTMFDDISGFGAWHRRWCLLSHHIISFWKYPDDEQKKVPIGTIDLRSVITENVNVVPHDVCARLNTFLLETTRSKLSEDKNSLVIKVHDNVTTIR